GSSSGRPDADPHPTNTGSSGGVRAPSGGGALRLGREEQGPWGGVGLLFGNLLGGGSQFELETGNLALEVCSVGGATLDHGTLLVLHQLDQLELEHDQMVLESRIAHAPFVARLGRSYTFVGLTWPFPSR